MDKMDRVGGIKTKRLYRCGSNLASSKFILDNELDDLWIDRIYRVYTDMKIANLTKINRIMVSFTDHYNAISLDRLYTKTKIKKD